MYRSKIARMAGKAGDFYVPMCQSNWHLSLGSRGSSGVSSKVRRCAASSPPPDLHRHFVKYSEALVNMLRIVEPRMHGYPKPWSQQIDWSILPMAKSTENELPWQVTHGSLNLLVNVASSAWRISYEIYSVEKHFRSKNDKEANASHDPSNYLLHKVEWRKDHPFSWRSEMLAQDQWAYWKDKLRYVHLISFAIWPVNKQRLLSNWKTKENPNPEHGLKALRGLYHFSKNLSLSTTSWSHVGLLTPWIFNPHLPQPRAFIQAIPSFWSTSPNFPHDSSAFRLHLIRVSSCLKKL